MIRIPQESVTRDPNSRIEGIDHNPTEHHSTKRRAFLRHQANTIAWSAKNLQNFVITLLGFRGPPNWRYICWPLSCNMSQAFIHSFTRVPKLIHHVFTYIHGMVPSPLPPPIHGQRESVTYNWISHPFNIHFLDPYMFVADSYQMTWTRINVGYSMTIGFRKVTTGLHIMWRILWWMNERYLLYMVHNFLSPSRTMPCFPILSMQRCSRNFVPKYDLENMRTSIPSLEAPCWPWEPAARRWVPLLSIQHKINV